MSALQVISSVKSGRATFWNEGVLLNIENFLKEKSEREQEFGRIKPIGTSEKCIYETDVCDQIEISSEFDIARRKIYDEWIVDLHKIQKNAKALDDFISKQKYEGIVIEIKESSFIARLRNLSSDSPDEEAEFNKEDLSKEDISLLKSGAIFYWNIGYRDMIGGQRIACHMINFRRLPVLTRQKIEKATQRAEKFLSWIDEK